MFGFNCVQYMGICYVIMFKGYNARTGTFLLRPLHHIWSHWIPSTHIQYISNMSQQHATASSPLPTGEDHAEGVVAHAAKVITQYTNGFKQHNNPEYWNKTTQVVWDELVSLGTYFTNLSNIPIAKSKISSCRLTSRVCDANSSDCSRCIYGGPQVYSKVPEVATLGMHPTCKGEQCQGSPLVQAPEAFISGPNHWLPTSGAKEKREGEREGQGSGNQERHGWGCIR